MNYDTSPLPLFPLGRVLVTPGARDLLSRTGTSQFSLLRRYQGCDWGTVSEADRTANDQSVKDGTRILAAYKLGAEKEPIWILTEADRSATTILLPGEY